MEPAYSEIGHKSQFPDVSISWSRFILKSDISLNFQMFLSHGAGSIGCFACFGFLVFFRFMVMALSDYFEERLHLLTRGTLDDFNARGSVLMMQDHKHISGKDYRV
jgi:hypothetical protein